MTWLSLLPLAWAAPQEDRITVPTGGAEDIVQVAPGVRRLGSSPWTVVTRMGDRIALNHVPGTAWVTADELGRAEPDWTPRDHGYCVSPSGLGPYADCRYDGTLVDWRTQEVVHEHDPERPVTPLPDGGLVRWHGDTVELPGVDGGVQAVRLDWEVRGVQPVTSFLVLASPGKNATLRKVLARDGESWRVAGSVAPGRHAATVDGERVAWVGHDGRVRITDVDGTTRGCVGPESPRKVAWSGDARVVAVLGTEAAVWCSAEGEVLHTASTTAQCLAGASRDVFVVDHLPDGFEAVGRRRRFQVSGADGCPDAVDPNRWRVGAGAWLRPGAGEVLGTRADNEITWMTLALDGRILVGNGRQAWVFDEGLSRTLATIPVPFDTDRDARRSIAGEHVYLGARVMRLDGTVVLELPGSEPPLAGELSPDGEVLVVLTTDEVRAVSVDDGGVLWRRSLQADPDLAARAWDHGDLVFTDGGRHVAVGNDTTGLRLLDARTGDVVRSLGQVAVMQLDGDGHHHLLVRTRATGRFDARMVDTRDGRVRWTETDVATMGFSGLDGAALVLHQDRDGSMRILRLDADTGRTLGTLSLPLPSSQSVSLAGQTASGRVLAIQTNAALWIGDP